MCWLTDSDSQLDLIQLEASDRSVGTADDNPYSYVTEQSSLITVFVLFKLQL